MTQRAQSKMSRWFTKLAWLGAFAVAASAIAAPAAALEPIACSTAIDELIDGAAPYSMRAIATSVTPNTSFGYSSLGLKAGTEIEQTPLHTQAFLPRRYFNLTQRDASNYAGQLTDVYTDRGNGNESLSELWIRRGGLLWVRSVEHNTPWKALHRVSCYQGPADQVVVMGHVDHAGGVASFWSFIIAPAPGPI
jgi:hypothetical protein